MAREAKKSSKSEVLSMRMDPTTRFLVDFIARVRGQSITTVVDRAILEAADHIKLEGDQYEDNWRDFWHVNEGIRSLKLWKDKRLFPTYEEQLIVSFTITHWPFFYVDHKCNSYKDALIDILWPKINEFVDLWLKTKSTDYFAVGKEMQNAILQAGVQPPVWPIKKIQQDKLDANKNRDQLDDDIPF